MSFDYPLKEFNVDELVFGDYKELSPPIPLLPSFAEYLLKDAGPPEVVVQYVDDRKVVDEPHVSDELYLAVYMPPLKSQACVVEAGKVSVETDEKLADYYQITYDEIPARIRYHCIEGEKVGLLPFVAEVNNVQFREAFKENQVEAISRRHYSVALDADKIGKSPWSPPSN